MSVTIKFRRGNSAEWTSSGSTVLASGEPGYEIDTGRVKIGNGVTPWSGLYYSSVIPTGFLAGSGINIGLGQLGSTSTISVTGLNSSYIGDFNSSVSGLLPVKNILPGSGISVTNTSGIYTINSTGSGLFANETASLITTVFNKTGSQIPKMTAVYISGGQGDQPLVGLAIATGDPTSAGTYGLTYEPIDNMSAGKVIVFGALTGVNTDQFNPSAPQGNVNGTVLYLSHSISGGLTGVKPYAPNHVVALGTVIRTHQNEGVIEVRIQNGFELEELHNVAVTGVTNGQFLQYLSASGLWIPSSSGNFSTLQVNSTGVSISGHTHVSSDITNFNTSVSGLVSGIYVRGTGVINHIPYWSDSRSIIADSGQLYWDSTNHRLGIGTGNPSDTIHITDGANNNTNLLIHNSANGYGDKSSLKLHSLTAGGGNSNSALSHIVAGTSVSPFSANYLDFKVGAWNNNNNVGSTLMRINSNGTVGVGVVNASGILNIVNTIQQDCGPLNVSTTGGVLTTRTHIAIGNSDSTPFLASLNGGLTGSIYGWGLFDRGTDGDFQIRRKAGSSSWIDVIHITRAAGNVGLSNNSPSFPLDVSGVIKSSSYITAATDLRLNNQAFSRVGHVDSSGGFVGGYNVYMSGLTPLHNSSGSLSACHYYSDGSIRFLTNSGQVANTTASEKIRINNSGNMGIGTISPLQKLDIRGNIYTSGNIGINTPSPTGALHVVGTGLFSSTTGVATNALLGIYSTTSGATVFSVEGTNGSLFSVVDNMSGTLMSVNNNAGLPVFEVFSNDSIVGGRFAQNDWVITSGGNVGIGTGVPSQRLHVAGHLRVSGAYYDSNNSAGISGQILSSTASGTSWISASGHSHTASQIIDFNEAVDDRIGSGLFVAGTGINLNYNDTNNSFTVSVTGLISNASNNRILTSRDSTTTGIDAETNATFDGTTLTISGAITVDNLNLDGNILSSTTGNIIISPSGGGALQRDSGGNTRGTYAVDWQGTRDASTKVAAGSYSVIGGGSSNMVSGYAGVVVGGGGNVVNGTIGFIGGGVGNSISGISSAIVGGQYNSDAGYNNVFILGSYISATQANTTYVENLDVSNTGDIDTLKINKFYHNNLNVSSGVSDTDLLITIVNPTGTSTTQVISASGLRSSLLNQPAALRFRQGTEAERLLITPASGEPIWTTDTQRFYIGDGATSGGDFIGPGPYTYAGTGYTNVVPIHSTNGYVSGNFSNILGGYNNSVSGLYMSIFNGQHNIITDTTGTIVAVSGSSSIINGTGNKIIEGPACIIGGGFRNSISGAIASVIVGGGDSIWGGNSISGSRNFIGGGVGNIIISGTNSSIVGGGWRGFSAPYGNSISSSFCFIGGGDRNVISTGSWWSAIIDGYNNSISSGCTASIICGGANNSISYATGLTVSFPVFGNQNTTAQTIGGGWQNQASGLYSMIPGGYRAKTTRFAELAHAAGYFGSVGDAQHSTLIARRSTTNNTANQILYLDETSYLLTLPAKTTLTFSIKLSAYNDTDSTAAGWIFRGAIKRDGANNTSIVGSIIEENWKDSAMTNTSASVVADDTNESLNIIVTGLTGKNIRWVAVIDTSQVSYGTP